MLALARAFLRPVDPGEVGGEVGGGAVAELDQVAPAIRHERRQRLLERAREHHLLVMAEEIAPEHPHLDRAARGVVGAVKGQQHAVHHHRPGVVERLLEIGVAQRRLALAVPGKRGRGAHSSALAGSNSTG